MNDRLQPEGPESSGTLPPEVRAAAARHQERLAKASARATARHGGASPVALMARIGVLAKEGDALRNASPQSDEERVDVMGRAVAVVTEMRAVSDKLGTMSGKRPVLLLDGAESLFDGKIPPKDAPKAGD